MLPLWPPRERVPTIIHPVTLHRPIVRTPERIKVALLERRQHNLGSGRGGGHRGRLRRGVKARGGRSSDQLADRGTPTRDARTTVAQGPAGSLTFGLLLDFRRGRSLLNQTLSFMMPCRKKTSEKADSKLAFPLRSRSLSHRPHALFLFTPRPCPPHGPHSFPMPSILHSYLSLFSTPLVKPHHAGNARPAPLELRSYPTYHPSLEEFRAHPASSAVQSAEQAPQAFSLRGKRKVRSSSFADRFRCFRRPT